MEEIYKQMELVHEESAQLFLQIKFIKKRLIELRRIHSDLNQKLLAKEMENLEAKRILTGDY